VPEAREEDRERDWLQSQEAAQRQERKEMAHAGTKWHVPASTSDCVIGPNGEVTGAAGCKTAMAPAEATLVQHGAL
jgi:hypothetical protein